VSTRWPKTRGVLLCFMFQASQDFLRNGAIFSRNGASG